MDALRWILDSLTVAAFVGVVILGYQCTLMWGDYKKKHRINGDYDDK